MDWLVYRTPEEGETEALQELLLKLYPSHEEWFQTRNAEMILLRRLFDEEAKP